MIQLLPGQRGQPAKPVAAEPLEAQLQRWTAAGLLTDGQAAAILTAERTRVAHPAESARRLPVTVELLGYLGGALAVIGAILLAARSWQDLAAWSRLTLLGLAAALWGAGAVVHEQAGPALWRLRAVLWLLSAAAVAFFAGLFGAEVLDLEGDRVALLAGLAAAAHAGALWRLQPRPLQHLACLAGVATAVGAAAAASGGASWRSGWACGPWGCCGCLVDGAASCGRRWSPWRSVPLPRSSGRR